MGSCRLAVTWLPFPAWPSEGGTGQVREDVPTTGTAEEQDRADPTATGRGSQGWAETSAGGSGSAPAARGGRLKNSIDLRRMNQRWPGMHWQNPARDAALEEYQEV